MSNQLEKSIDKLAKEAIAGNKQAEKELFAKLSARFLNLTKRRIYRTGIDVLEIEKDAQDIVQDALTTIFKKYTNEAEERPFLPWSFQVLRYKIGNYFKKSKRSRTVSIDTQDGQAPFVDVANKRLEDSLEYEDFVNKLKKALAQMSGDCKKILTIFLEGDSRKDIIKLFEGIPLGTIDNKIYRCREKLKSMLQKEGVTW